MMSESIVQNSVDTLLVVSKNLLLPLMSVAFVISVVMRILNYYTLRRQEFFTSELKRRIDAYFETIEDQTNVSFFHMTKKLLMITYYEIFEVTALLQRRRPDMIMTFTDRVFLTKQGFAWLVKNTMKQMRYLKTENHRPQMVEVSKSVFQNNPAFTRVFGYIDSAFLNEMLNTLPGLFIIGGIFGTFLGFMKALPELSHLNPDDIEGAKRIMDTFLIKLSFSMSTSIMGILFSTALTLVNTVFSAERVYMRTIENFENCLLLLWQRSDNNHIPLESLKFDEHKNPLEALAEEAVNKEYAKMRQKMLAEEAKHGPQKTDLPKAS